MGKLNFILGFFYIIYSPLFYALMFWPTFDHPLSGCLIFIRLLLYSLGSKTRQRMVKSRSKHKMCKINYPSFLNPSKLLRHFTNRRYVGFSWGLYFNDWGPGLFYTVLVQKVMNSSKPGVILEIKLLVKDNRDHAWTVQSSVTLLQGWPANWILSIKKVKKKETNSQDSTTRLLSL